jgi:hypothetical protein
LYEHDNCDPMLIVSSPTSCAGVQPTILCLRAYNVSTHRLWPKHVLYHARQQSNPALLVIQRRSILMIQPIHMSVLLLRPALHLTHALLPVIIMRNDSLCISAFSLPSMHSMGIVAVHMHLSTF